MAYRQFISSTINSLPAMDHSWILIVSAASLALCFLLTKLISSHTKRGRLPPGPPGLFIIAKLLWLRRSIFDIEDILRALRSRYGPIISLNITSPPTVVIFDRHLAHRALVHNSVDLAGRPPATDPDILLTSNQHDISSSPYGPLWRLLRRNLASAVLHPSRAPLFAPARRLVLQILIDKLSAEAGNGDSVVVPVGAFQYAMLCLLLLMCFGELPDEKVIRDIEAAETYLLLNFTKFNVFEFFPAMTKVLFRRRWGEIVAARRTLEKAFRPLITARQKQGQRPVGYAYVDSLLELELPEDEGRRPTFGETVSLCSEFLTAGTDTTTTALQWVMANLVTHPEVQQRVVREIERVVGRDAAAVEEDDLAAMPYLKAVVMEGLRRHPPGHFLLPHAAGEEVEIGGYVIPRGAAVNFAVAEMNWDGEVWEEPMEFRPERFLGGGKVVELITGNRENEMMTFGAGRRVCPGMGLAVLHLEYFVANLVREFEWKVAEGEVVDMSEKLEFTVRMKEPLRVRLSPRRNT